MIVSKWTNRRESAQHRQLLFLSLFTKSVIYAHSTFKKTVTPYVSDLQLNVTEWDSVTVDCKEENTTRRLKRKLLNDNENTSDYTFISDQLKELLKQNS